MSQEIQYATAQRVIYRQLRVVLLHSTGYGT